MSKPVFDFSNQHVFVAGGTSGINLGIATAFGAAGARVTVLSRSAEKVEAAQVRLRATGAPSTAGFSVDVRRYDDVAAAMRDARDQHGLIDVLVSGAAGNFPAAMSAMSSNAFRSVIDIDLLGTFNVARASFEHLRRPGASIINISAPQALTVMPMQGHVSAAKAGVDMITKSLAIEWGAHGIRVNSVIPGPIRDTEGMRRLAPSREAEDVVTASVPLGRWGIPEDVANACLFLASPYASYVSGAILPVDGAWHLGGSLIAVGKISDLFGTAKARTTVSISEVPTHTP